MDIQEHLNGVWFCDVFQQLFREKHSRTQDMMWDLPLSIQVHPTNIAPKIAQNHAIDVHHRHNHEIMLFQQLLRLLIPRMQEFYDPLRHKRRHRLPWVLSGNNNHCRGLFVAELNIGDLITH